MKFLLQILLVLLPLLSSAQEDLSKREVPADVKNKLHLLYPNARRVIWLKERGQYIADFYANQIPYTLTFDIAGNLLKTEEDIPVEQLPEKASKFVTTNYPEEKILRVQKIKDNTFRIQYRAMSKEMDFVFNAEGELISIREN